MRYVLDVDNVALNNYIQGYMKFTLDELHGLREEKFLLALSLDNMEDEDLDGSKGALLALYSTYMAFVDLIIHIINTQKKLAESN